MKGGVIHPVGVGLRADLSLATLGQLTAGSGSKYSDCFPHGYEGCKITCGNLSDLIPDSASM